MFTFRTSARAAPHLSMQRPTPLKETPQSLFPPHPHSVDHTHLLARLWSCLVAVGATSPRAYYHCVPIFIMTLLYPAAQRGFPSPSIPARDFPLFSSRPWQGFLTSIWRSLYNGPQRPRDVEPRVGLFPSGCAPSREIGAPSHSGG